MASAEGPSLRRFLTILACATLLLASGAGAVENGCETDENAIPIAVGGDTYYVVSDPCQPLVGDGTCLFSVWMFEEGNGQPGLQRDDGFGSCEGDVLVF